MAERRGFTWRACAAAGGALALAAGGAAHAQLIANARPSEVAPLDAQDESVEPPALGVVRGSSVDAEQVETDVEHAPASEPDAGELSDAPPQEGLALGAADARSDRGATAGAPQDEQRGALAGGLVKSVGSLALVLGLIVGAWLVVKKLTGSSGALIGQLGPGGRAPSGLLTVLGRYPVARGQTLVLLKLDQRVLLLSQTSAGFRTLSELTDPEEVASILVKARDEEGNSMAHRFRSLLKSAERDPAFAGAGLGSDAGPTSVRAAWAREEPPCNGPLPLVAEHDEASDAASALRRRLRSLQGGTA